MALNKQEAGPQDGDPVFAFGARHPARAVEGISRRVYPSRTDINAMIFVYSGGNPNVKRNHADPAAGGIDPDASR